MNDRIRIIFLAELVKGWPTFGIDFRDFNKLPVIHPTDVDIIVEVDRTRRLGSNLRELKTRLRKDENLGRNGNLQLLQEGTKIAIAFVVIQNNFVGLDLLGKISDRIGAFLFSKSTSRGGYQNSKSNDQYSCRPKKIHD